jgi:integration host factor subunit alpha
MTKKDITDHISEKANLTRKESVSAVESTFDIIKEELEKGNDVMISTFGKWTILHKRERKGRNPQTGEAMAIKARKIISFKPSSVLRDELNKEN